MFINAVFFFKIFFKFYKFGYICFQIESLYPEVMGSNVMSVEDFLDNGLLLLDKDIQERVYKASLNGNVLRYVCVIEGSRSFFYSL